jgi:hypothetical protein
MHHANHFYGHAHIMAKYAGLQHPPRIWGYLQHGWNILDGFAVGTPFVDGMPKFVWSDGVRRRGWSMDRRDYYIVGAPWLYLLELEPELAKQTPDAAGTIFYPFHGWEGQHVLGDHGRIVASINEHEEGPITICLYWNEYRVPEIRHVYERAGFRVITHGYRGLYWRKTDTEFLYNQLKELRKHKRVASNRLSSAIFYGTSMGLQPGVYGDPMVLQNEHPAFGGVPRMERLWPHMHQPFVPMDQAVATMRTELGSDYLARPEEIRELFRWEN